MRFGATDDDAIVISRQAVDSGEPLAVMVSLTDYLDGLRLALVRETEINPAALQHHAVDFYVTNVANGGHAQFEQHASEADLAIFQRVGSGLESIGHARAMEIWERFMTIHRSRPASRTSGDLHELDSAFFAVYSELERANTDSLLAHPDLVIVEASEMESVISSRAQRMHPPLAERRSQRFNSAPAYEQAAMTYCDENRLLFRGVLGRHRIDERGRTGTAWVYRVAGGADRVVLLFDDGTVEHRANIDA
ncbi:hypothetical protein JVX90_18910 [Gordonia sp. PDNC005]|uniref:DMP19 family protein n=1 Tax=unclassified Gordonia (in: high G+C Gram-positive bacteria) TaxID=2657482 RepID=UPI0019645C93|nr:hypothetical protein [Gordonia sp. PDNC005]QRY62413.1 hypothetical protein JVX90_18910 [Gordonia sp. PDNC005]